MSKDLESSVDHWSQETSRSKAAILLVDDRPDNLDAREAVLKDFGQDLIRARSGQEALRLLFDRDFAVILLDVRMPDMDGFETAELIRKRRRSRHTPIIFITAADATPNQIARGYCAGGVDFIFKPYLSEVLKAKVGIFLELFQKSEEIRESEARFRTLITNVRGAVYRRKAEPPWEFQFVSDPIAGLSGYAASEFIEGRKSYASVVHPDDAKVLSSALEEAAKKGVSFGLEYRIVRADGRTCWVLDQGRAVASNSSKAEHLDGFLFEVTGRKVAEEVLRDFLGRLIETRDNERRRVALELYDSTSPLLASLTGKLYTLRHSSRELGPGASKILDDSLKLVDDVSHIVRNLSQLLHPSMLEQSGLLAGLRWYISDFTKRTGIPVDMRLPETLVRLSQDAEIALFRVAQESLASFLRRSTRPAVTVSLSVGTGEVTLEVSDKGQGMSRGSLGKAESEDMANHLGFAGMRERMRQLAGNLEISSQNALTTVVAVLPLNVRRTE